MKKWKIFLKSKKLGNDISGENLLWVFATETSDF